MGISTPNKSANSEKALSIGFGIHRAYKIQSMISKYSHAFYMNNNQDSTLNDLSWSNDAGNSYGTREGTTRKADTGIEHFILVIGLVKVKIEHISQAAGHLTYTFDPGIFNGDHT